MTWRRRTYVVDVSGHDVDPATEHAVYRVALDTLRGAAGRVIADLLPRTAPLPPAARDAAFVLQQSRGLDLSTSTERNPFQAVTVDAGDDEQWRALLAVAPYAPDLRLEVGLFTDLFSSEGGLRSVRLRLRPDELARVRDALAADPGVPSWLQLRER